jgi:hypothetical protein
VTEVPKPIDTALDLFLYVPVGLAMTAAEELPKLAAKGRTRINTQLTMARVVGQFAVSRGRQELEKRLAPAGPPAGPSRRSAAEAPAPAPTTSTREEDHGPHRNGKVEAVAEPVSSVAVATAAPSAPTGPVPASGELAIPGYDSLSASQVVQRLAGLSQDELTAVGDYERAHRGRRTILNRIDQLQGH